MTVSGAIPGPLSLMMMPASETSISMTGAKPPSSQASSPLSMSSFAMTNGQSSNHDPSG